MWATWQQDNQIYVNRTLNGDDHTWGTPFVLPVGGTSVTVDDNSAVVAFAGNKIGVMWSNETTSNDAMFFAGPPRRPTGYELGGKPYGDSGAGHRG